MPRAKQGVQVYSMLLLAFPGLCRSIVIVHNYHALLIVQNTKHGSSIVMAHLCTAHAVYTEGAVTPVQSKV